MTDSISSISLILGIDEEDGSWRLRLGEPGTRPDGGVLSAEAVSALRNNVGALLRPRPGVAVRGRDLALSRREEQVGQALASALRKAGLTERLARALGRGCGVLAVDGAADGVRALPWELLSADPGAPPMAEQGMLVCRLVPGTLASTPVPGSALLLRLWAPDAIDPLCARRLTALQGLAAELGIEAVGIDAPRSGTPEILHVICHGQVHARAVGLSIGGVLQSVGTVSQQLSGVLRGAAAVVLDVCQAAAPEAAESRSLAVRLIGAGASACFAPTRPLSVAASERFSVGLYTALAEGADLPGAAAAARLAVVGLALPRSDARWHVMALFLSDLSLLGFPPVVRRGGLPSWPSPGADAVALIDGMVAASERLDSGFIGIEHLIEAICTMPPGSAIAHLRAILVPRLEGVRQGLAARVRRSGRSGSTSPRLIALGAGLSPGFSQADLIAATWPPICVLLGMDARLHHTGDSTLELGAFPRRAPQTPTALEVLSGPEDGRRLILAPGDEIGRFSDAVQIAAPLYRDTAVHDPFLSRRHLVWLGGGRLRLARPGQCDGEMIPAGEVRLQSGDVLVLTPGTRLRMC